MIVGLCKFSLPLFGNCSVKEKKKIVGKIREKVFSHLKVQIREVEELDRTEMAILGFALVGVQEEDLRNLIHKTTEFIEEEEGLRVEGERIELFYF